MASRSSEVNFTKNYTLVYLFLPGRWPLKRFCVLCVLIMRCGLIVAELRQRYHAFIVSKEWLLDSIGTYDVKPLDPYLVIARNLPVPSRPINDVSLVH